MNDCLLATMHNIMPMSRIASRFREFFMIFPFFVDRRNVVNMAFNAIGRWSTDFRRTDKPHEFSASTRMCRAGIYTREMPKVFTLDVEYQEYLH